MGIIIVGAIILVVLASIFGRGGGAKPGDPFTCPGYGRRSAHPAKHNNRSANAKGTAYCNKCHEAWLKDQTSTSGPSGCFGLVLLGFVLAVGVLVVKFA